MSTRELAETLLARVRGGDLQSGATLHDAFMTNQALSLLELSIEQRVDNMENRFSRHWLSKLFHTYHDHRPEAGLGPIEDATYIELGCGSLNPLSLLMVFVLLGARRGIGIDMDPVADVPIAAKALARSASLMLADPPGIVGAYPVTREEIARRAEAFDLGKLRAGDASGLNETKLAFHHGGLHDLQLADGEVDRVLSNSVLEHVADVDGLIAEMHRVTSANGEGCHQIDGVDHTSYSMADRHALDFLRIDSGEPLIRGCNRIRPLEYLPIFERHGFDVVDVHVYRRDEVDDETRASFVEPFRSMSGDLLETSGVILRVRKRRRGGIARVFRGVGSLVGIARRR